MTDNRKAKTEWTPGPWTRCDAETDEVSSNHGWFVKVAPCRIVSVEGRTSDEADANADLIAAAPELYEALKESQAELECVYDELRKHQAPKISAAFLRLMNQNRAALTKAKGFFDENQTPDGVGENND